MQLDLTQKNALKGILPEVGYGFNRDKDIKHMTQIIIIYLVIINIVAYAMMGIDKRKAQRKEWRISEAALFVAALLGGSIGSIAGMQRFRHKTKHWYFKYGMPAILVAQVALAVYLLLLK